MDNVSPVYLRPLRVEDAQTSVRWRNNPAVWEQTFSRPDREVTLEMEEAWARKVIADPTRANFAICLSENDRYIGNIYLTEITSYGTGSDGIFIGETDLWGRGLGTAARHELWAWAKANGIHTIYSRIYETNPRSYKSVEKLGFTLLSRSNGTLIYAKHL